MNISGQQRRIVLAASLILTLAAAGWIGDEENHAPVVVAASSHAAKPEHKEAWQHGSNAAISETELRLELLNRRPMKIRRDEMFAGKSWYVPPPPPPPAPPPPPTPPSLPFTYLGKLLEDGQLTVFLSKMDRNYIVKPGDVIEGTYRVEEISGGMMVLTYLPLDMKQTLYIGDAN